MNPTTHSILTDDHIRPARQRIAAVTQGMRSAAQGVSDVQARFAGLDVDADRRGVSPQDVVEMKQALAPDMADAWGEVVAAMRSALPVFAAFQGVAPEELAGAIADALTAD